MYLTCFLLGWLETRRCSIAIAFNSGLQYTITKVHVNQDALKLICTYQLVVYADDINIMGGSVHTIKKNAEALVVA